MASLKGEDSLAVFGEAADEKTMKATARTRDRRLAKVGGQAVGLAKGGGQAKGEAGQGLAKVEGHAKGLAKVGGQAKGPGKPAVKCTWQKVSQGCWQCFGWTLSCVWVMRAQF